MKRFFNWHMSLLLALLLAPASLWAQFSQSDADTRYATTLPKAGDVAPVIKMKTLDGNSFNLTKLRGHYVVLDFWASWCPDCRRDIPDMVRLYQKFHPQGVEFVGVSMDTDRDKWRAAVDKYGIAWTQVSELVKFHDTQVSKDYGVKWIPSMVLLDPEGKVVLSTVLWSKLENTLTQLVPTGKTVATTQSTTTAPLA